MSQLSAVITDLDNTIYNWVDFYVPSFLAMTRELSLQTGLPEDDLKAAFKRLHEKHGTTEYSFAILELDVFKERDRNLSVKEILQKYQSAISAFRETRNKTLRLYEGVSETLRELRKRGKKIIAHTDALMFHAVARLKQLDVEDLYDGIFAPPDHGFPEGVAPEDVRSYDDPDRYRTLIPLQVELDPTIRKPDTRSLATVVSRLGILPAEAIYVGDSVTRDILMAQQCGVADVLAAYGRDVDPQNYAELVRITYWDEQKFAEEAALRRIAVTPSWTIRSFTELLSVIEQLENRTG